MSVLEWIDVGVYVILRKINNYDLTSVWQLKTSQMSWLLKKLGDEFKPVEEKKGKGKRLGVPTR